MLSELMKHPDFTGAVDAMKARLAGIVMAKASDDEARQEALSKFHLLDDLLTDLANIGEIKHD